MSDENSRLLVLHRVIRIIDEEFAVDPERLTEKAELEYDLNLDSLDIIELIQQIEGEFKIEIPDYVADKFYTVGDVVNFLMKHI